MAPTRTRKITSLTPEQEAMLPVYAERWTRIGLSTEPADRPAAEAAIHEMYRCGGLEPPKQIVWTQSPFGMMIDASKAGRADDVWRRVGSDIGATVAGKVMASVSGAVWRQAWDEILPLPVTHVAYEVRRCIRSMIDQELRFFARARALDYRDNAFQGQHAAHWLAIYDFFAEQCGLVEETARLSGLWGVAETAGWVLPFQDVCYASERHEQLTWDANGWPHCSDGPALSYLDGSALHFWHGILIDARIIEDRDRATPAAILAEPNVEIRRIRMELFEEMHGAGSLVREFDARLIAEDEAHGRPRRLYAVPGIDDARMLVVENGTADSDEKARTFSLFVPVESETPQDAAAWSYGWPSERFSEAVRT